MLRPVRLQWQLFKEYGKLSSAFEKAVTSAAYPYIAMNFIPRWQFVPNCQQLYQVVLNL
jgi:hypothetical protein